MALSILVRPIYTKTNENELSTNGCSGISGDRLDNRIVNLSSFTKKISSGAGFFIPKTSLAFTQLRKAFTKAPILYHFDLERYIQIEIDVSGYAINRLLSQMTTKRGLAG